jgi:pimeloyl-ACP methyl ester carboxylesterase
VKTTISKLAVISILSLAVPFQAQGEERINPTDLMVPHRSTIPANVNAPVQLFVRERDGTPPGAPPDRRRAVLMLHGRSVPALAGGDLDHRQYNWAADLAQKGFDVFVMDLQGSGRSPRPKMDDPCNANPALQSVLIPNPLSAPCSASYQSQLNNSKSDWDELNTVIDYIINNRQVSKVALIGWSAAAFQIGPYAVQNPGKVASILFYAPVFPPDGRASKPGTRFDAPVRLPVSTPAGVFGFPMNIGTKNAFKSSWDKEQHCPQQRDDGMVDVVWNAIMDNDAIGRYWGPGEGVMRVRNSYWWGWNKDTAGLDGTLGGAVPVLIVYGDLDTQANTAPDLGLLYFSVPRLYQTIRYPNKLMFRVACAGHSMVWERQSRVLRRMSEQWLRQGTVAGLKAGSYFVNEDDGIEVIEEPPQ